MPSAYGRMNFIMEKQKSGNSVAPGQLIGEPSTFICTECGDGFSQYPNLLAHMATHGPLESFSFDGSSNGFEIPREYVLHENGILTVVNGFGHSDSPVKPASPGILPSHYHHPATSKPMSPAPRPQPSSCRDVFRSRPPDLNMDKSRQIHYRCEVCSRSFSSLQSLHRHQQYRNTERGYKCTLCCRMYEARQDLKKHLKEHTSERFHCCGHCGKRFSKADALNAHRKENHSINSTTASDRPDHKQGKKTEKPYSCRKCKLNFFWMSDYQTHSLYHCKGKESIATFSSEIENEVNFKNGEVTTHGNCHNGKPVSIKNGDSKIFRDSSGKLDYSFTPYRCGLCGDRFQKLTDLKEHHRTHQTQEEIDQLSQESQRTFKRKIPPKSRRRRNSNPNGKLHPCKHCHRVFNHSSSLSRHMRYHKGTMHTCVLCGRHFPQRCDLRRHIAMYHKTELEKKPGLKNLFTNPQNGPGNKSVIPEKFTSPPDEKTKSSSDTEQTASQEQHPGGKQSGKGGRMSYKCQECGKKFGLLCVYQRHLRYHKKEPSKCPKCPAQFMNSSSLELHLQNHPSNRDSGDAGRAGHSPGSGGEPAQEKSNQEDIEDNLMDSARNDKANPSEALYECTECTETFSCLETFLQHQSSHGSEKNG